MTGFTRNTPSERAGSTRAVAVAVVLCAVQFVDVLGVTVVTAALPSMLRDLDASPAQGAMVVNAYALFFGGLLMVAARLGDRVGHRRVLLAALGLFAAASVPGAVAGSVWVLAASRALQGVAAAASVPAALRLLTTVVPEGPARRRAIAGWSAAGAAAGGCGLVLGGLLTQLVSWRAAFWADIVLGVLLAAAVVRAIPRDELSGESGRIGWLSAATLTIAAMGIVAGTTLLGDSDSMTAALLVVVVGVVAAFAFVVAERRATHPLVPPRARRSPQLKWGAIGSFFVTATSSASVTVATLHLQDELGLGPLAAGTVLVGLSVLVVAGSVVAPRLLRAFGWGPVIGVGLGTIAVGTGLLAAWPHVVVIGLGTALSGLGVGIGSVASNDLGTSVVEALKGTATGVLNTAAQLGTAVGTALTVLVATTIGPRPAWLFVTAYAVLAALATTARGPRRSSATQREETGVT